MRTLSIVSILVLSLAAGAASAAAKGPLAAQFDSEDKASIHCPLDKIVWVNPRKRLWYAHQSKHYANDGVGGFGCKEEAVKAGYKQGQ